MSITRTRLAPAESRAAAIDAARRLLLDHGPQAVTLKAVGAAIGRTHANLLHHFGSASGLQAELARSIAVSVTTNIRESVERARSGDADPAEIVERTFDAFSREGAGPLAAWMILSGNRDALNPILGAIRDLVDQLSVGHEGHQVPHQTMALVVSALGDALLGPAIAEALGVERNAARAIAANALRLAIRERHPAA